MMLLRRLLERLPWQLTCVLLTMGAAADIVPSNESTNIQPNGATVQLRQTTYPNTNLTELAPLTQKALDFGRRAQSLEGNLYNTNTSDANSIQTGDISYFSCDPENYQGFVTIESVFQTTYLAKNITAVILYSTVTNYCNYTNLTDNLNNFPIYSATNKADSQTILNAIAKLPSSMQYRVTIARAGSSDNGGNNPNNQQQANPLGPSPSTAVAMIILYSITGIITALFLVIIITGAIRAHRHPDRYGPRDVLGRPRQSRARGLGRAILDTIPIVKFGERDTPKPTDVELGSASEARNVNDENGTTETVAQSSTGTEANKAVGHTESQSEVTAEPSSGIAPAEASSAATATGQENKAVDEALGCSICTDDFEKGQDIRVLPCDHKFHPECVDPWLLNVSGTCPLCRIDLRPVASRNSEDEQDPDSLAPPLQPENDISYRRRSGLRDILSLRSRPNASTEERISALRRLREQRRNQSGDEASGSANASTEDVTANRRSRRISVRLHDVFSVRTRRGDQEDSAPAAEASSNASSLPRADDHAIGGSSSNATEEQRRT